MLLDGAAGLQSYYSPVNGGDSNNGPSQQFEGKALLSNIHE